MKNQSKNDRWLNTIAALLTAILAIGFLRAEGQSIQDPPFGRPDAVVDLSSREGVDLVKGQWRYHDVKIVEADSRTVGLDLKPSGDPSKTYDYEPHAGVADFDDSHWEAIDAATLEQRRSTAKVCFNWYRINVTIPEKVGGFSTAGSTVAFEIVIDDYAEIWVNGKMPRVLGQPGGPVIKGFNASESRDPHQKRAARSEYSACGFRNQWAHFLQPAEFHLDQVGNARLLQIAEGSHQRNASADHQEGPRTR